MEKGDGMSFSEFTYPLLQGWDWWHMYNTMGVQVQVGGSDQYGNIVAGMDAVRYIAQSQEDSREQQLSEQSMPMGLTVPLLTTASGEKFGKSAGNAVWLDRNMTSSFDLYGVSTDLVEHSSSYMKANATSSFFCAQQTLILNDISRSLHSCPAQTSALSWRSITVILANEKHNIY